MLKNIAYWSQSLECSRHLCRNIQDMKFKIGSASQMIKQLIYGWLQSNKMVDYVPDDGWINVLVKDMRTKWI